MNNNQMRQEVMKKLSALGIDKHKVDKILYEQGLAEMMDRIFTKVSDDLKIYMREVQKRCEALGGKNWKYENPEILTHVTEAGRIIYTESGMPSHIYNGYIRYAREVLLGSRSLRDGHTRLPRMEDMLRGRSNDPVQDICIMMLEETFKRFKEKDSKHLRDK